MICVFKSAKGLKQFIKNTITQNSEAEVQLYIFKGKLKL
jgi:hypothetical protein